MPYEEDEIDETRRGEERRGKRPIDIAERRRKLILLRKFEEALKGNDVESFKEAVISDFGWMPGTPEYDRALKAWYEQRRRR
jgi:hypothetical protein